MLINKNYKKSQENQAILQNDLKQTQEKLKTTSNELIISQKSQSNLQDALNRKNEELKTKSEELKNSQKSYSNLQIELKQTQDQLKISSEELKNSQKSYSNLQIELDQTEREKQDQISQKEILKKLLNLYPFEYYDYIYGDHRGHRLSPKFANLRNNFKTFHQSMKDAKESNFF